MIDTTGDELKQLIAAEINKLNLLRLNTSDDLQRKYYYGRVQGLLWVLERIGC